MTYQGYSVQLLETAELHWRDLLDRCPDLAPAVELQRRIVTRTFELMVVIDQKCPARVTLDADHLASKLRSRTPALVGEAIEFDSIAVVPFVLGFCEDLASGEAGGGAGRLRETLDRAQIDIGSLLAASLGRRQEAIRTRAHHVGVAPDLLWLVAELASGPVAHRLELRLLTELHDQNDELRSAIGEWKEGYCPACGSWPAFREQAPGETNRSLRCSFCGAAWPHPHQTCIYCDEGGDSLIAAAIDPRRPSRHVEICRQCGGYLKCIDVGRPTPFSLLSVEDLSTCDLDLGAVERGYARPPMHDFAGARDLPCAPPPTA